MDRRKLAEYSRVSTIELATVTRARMTRIKALQTLGLKGFPSPKVFETKVRQLLGENAEDSAAIIAAHSRLRADHRSALESMRDTINTAYANFQEGLEAFVAAAPDLETVFKSFGSQLMDKNSDYCRILEGMYVDMQQVERDYKEDFAAIVLKASEAVTPDLKMGFTAGLRTLAAQIMVAYESNLADEDEMEVVFDQIDMFNDEYMRYLEDLIDLQTLERSQLEMAHENAKQPFLYAPRYANDLQRLHGELEKLGRHYFSEIRKDNADVQALQIELSKGFSKAVLEAEQAFAKEPGILANLNCILKILCVCTILPALVILFCCEKTEDRNRWFHGAPQGELNMKETWKNWSMDMMPSLDGKTSRPSRQG